MHSGAAIRSRRSYGAKARSYAAVNERVMFIALPNNGCHGISNVSAEQREQFGRPAHLPCGDTFAFTSASATGRANPSFTIPIFMLPAPPSSILAYGCTHIRTASVIRMRGVSLNCCDLVTLNVTPPERGRSWMSCASL
jgi:hypothetical protein